MPKGKVKKSRSMKVEFRLFVSWKYTKMDIDLAMERNIGKIAKKFGGGNYGSGCGFGYRDSDYGPFSSVDSAVTAAKEIKDLLKQKGRTAIKTTINIEDIEV